MLKIDIISCQPGMFEGFLAESIVARAVKKGACEINVVNLRDFGEGNYRKIDDKPYGGGPGCLMTCGPWFAAVEKCLGDATGENSGERRGLRNGTRIIMTSPGGKRFTQSDAEALAKEEHLIFMCGHYEGFDERIRTLATDEFSLGDFVMTGGELAAAAWTDSVVRLLPGVLGGGAEATASESFANGGGLEFPQYTHPAIFRGMAVPQILLGGDHSRAVTRQCGAGYLFGYWGRPVWSKPIVVLANENTGSNGEIFSHAIKTLKRGKLVGRETGGGVIGTYDNALLDLGSFRDARYGWFLLDGTDMENHGAKPDVVVEDLPGDLDRGLDVQLDKAIEVLAADVEAWRAANPPIDFKYSR